MIRRELYIEKIIEQEIEIKIVPMMEKEEPMILAKLPCFREEETARRI